MAYGDKQVGFTINDGVNVVTQEMEYDGKVLTVEVRISEKYGFVDVTVNNHATGDGIDLDVQFEKGTDNIEAALTSNDELIGTLDKDGFYAKEDNR